ncbi:helix-turn-helix domain-containing protein [Vibrio sagamiensis]|uniref:HTH cro/C1-type domain-containing protein n=1 Tax=Vibrio sagamiensis NBRC 104589 TaxID=1219064 RepID=A0A511QDF2_9VIBR|nr:helix-turn-helix transcriptional regulator [Vibrio sagamiensis]GEM75331.1 hypothetical protein VSA01S_14430 [Vibrio sagamiensis NBRC 104589]
MNGIAERLKELRRYSGLSRRKIEMMSKGEIKQSSLSTFENGQSNISIEYLKKLTKFYKDIGISVSYPWLLEGEGPPPLKKDHMGLNFSCLQEAQYFQDLNPLSIIISANKSFDGIIEIGDFLGGAPSFSNKENLKTRILVLVNKEVHIVKCYIFMGFVIILENDTIRKLDLSKISMIYDIIWIRKNI